MASDSYHEPYELIPAAVRDMHRAYRSLMEELEAIDWYSQRASVTEDDELRAVLEHNRDEEVEHAMMTLEWIRRRVPVFDRYAKQYLFTEGSLLDIESRSGAEPGARGDLGIGGRSAKGDS